MGIRSTKRLIGTLSLLFHSTLSMTVPKNVVVVGGGIQGTAVAYFLDKQNVNVILLEAVKPASAASGKGGGFMARSWGDGSPTQRLHEVAFDLYPSLCAELGCNSYRKLPVFSVNPGKRGQTSFPSWLDGNFARINSMGDDTAQVTPAEFVQKMLEKSNIEITKGTCCGVTTAPDNSITGVKYRTSATEDIQVISTDAVVVSAGPWSSAAEDWFDNIQLPMEGIKSTSIVWKNSGKEVDAAALFCGEDNRFGTHRTYSILCLRP